MRVAVLTPSYEDSRSPFKGHDTPCDPSPWAPAHEWTRVVIHKTTAVAQVRDLARQGFDVFVNLCDGGFDEDRPGIEVVHALERYGCAFTGAESHFYEPTREAMKRVCASWGIDTAEYVLAHDPEDIERAATTLRFPMIVKHHSSYGSIGMGPDAKVDGPNQLRAVAARMIGEFGGALIEEFVQGREFTVLVAENPEDPDAPLGFHSVECTFPSGETFKHFDLKWKDFEGLAWLPVTDPELDLRLRDAARRMFLGCRGTGYGRCDVRMGQDGRLVMLEINPNCGIFYERAHWGSADQILHVDPRGHGFFVETILRAALARKARKVRPTEIRRTAIGYGQVARRDLAEGELVWRGEAKPYVLVSGKWAQNLRTELERDWFRRYAWPIGDDVHAIWHDDPMDWEPIDHSCDPNAWFSGLDLVARRPIRRGEAVTVDYATFCGDRMEPFPCACGSAGCRGTIRGTDHALPEVRERYGDRVSDWVRRRR